MPTYAQNKLKRQLSNRKYGRHAVGSDYGKPIAGVKTPARILATERRKVRRLIRKQEAAKRLQEKRERNQEVENLIMRS